MFGPFWVLKVLHSTVQSSLRLMPPAIVPDAVIAAESNQPSVNSRRNSNKIVELQTTLAHENRHTTLWEITGNRAYLAQSVTRSHRKPHRTIRTVQQIELAIALAPWKSNSLIHNKGIRKKAILQCQVIDKWRRLRYTLCKMMKIT